METKHFSPESETGVNYLELIKDELGRRRDYLRYDAAGDLWINDLRVMDLVEYGTPLEIVDTRIIEKRCRDWESLTQQVAKEVGYRGGFKYFYAAKANFDAEFTSTAYRAGWNAETTSTQDLVNIEWLAENGLFDKSKTEIVCNGFFLDARNFGNPAAHPQPRSAGVSFESSAHVTHAGETDYLKRILSLRKAGYKITPILYDLDEVNSLLATRSSFEVGLRLKFGKVDNDADLSTLASRHGMTFEEMQAAGSIISREDQLTITTFHAMVGAAENIPVEQFGRSLLFAADKYFLLKKELPQLRNFDMGGGIPPLGDKYDHTLLLRTFLLGMKERARASGMEEPTIVFEQGSPIASEAGFDVMKIVSYVQNNVDKNGMPQTWAIGDLSVIATIPDIWFINKRFTILAANHADKSARKVLLSDLTCDSGSIYPEPVLIPDTNEDMFLVILGTGAYQNALAGEGGVHHCGLYEDAKWKIVSRNGRTKAVLAGRQAARDLREALGYHERALEYLR